MEPVDARARRAGVPAWLERLAGWSWRIVAVAAAVVILVWLLTQLWVVVLATVIAVFLTRVLAGPATWLRARGWRSGISAAVVLVGFLVVVGGVLTLIGAAVADTSGEIGSTLDQALDDIEVWLADDGPFDLDRADVAELRREATDALDRAWRNSSNSLVSGARIALETLIAIVLGLILTFFALKDGEPVVRWVRDRLPVARRTEADRVAAAAWSTIGGYLRGAAFLGVVEGITIGVALALVGSELAIVVGVLTFMAAFVPFVGALIAGAIAVLVALATAGTVGALIVLAVAVVVQQFDNDLLAPVIYGKALSLHPAVVLVVITGGGALFGIAGSLLAVPVAAVAINVAGAERAARRELAAGTAPDAC